MTPEERVERLMSAMTADDLERLTHHKADLTEALIAFATKVWALGYEEGVKRGGQLMAESIKARMAAR